MPPSTSTAAERNAHRIGRLLGDAAAAFPFHKFTAANRDDTLSEAGVLPERYELELLVLSLAAALHAIETAGLTPEVENAVAQGLYTWIHEQEPARKAFLLQNIEEVVEVVSAAALLDQENPPSPTDFAAVDEEFGERLMALGSATESRMAACLRLCLNVPSTLWRVQVAGAKRSLQEEGLVQPLQ